MQTFENEVKTNETVAIDGKRFVNCRFVRCTLVYAGEDYQMINCQMEECRASVTGAAQRTAQFLQMTGVIPNHIQPVMVANPAAPGGGPGGIQ